MRSSIVPRIVPRILALSLGLLATSRAFANQNHAVTCSVDPADASSINFTHFGVQNTSTAPHVVHCGGMKGSNPFNTTMFVTVYDRSFTDSVRCNVFLTNPGGDVIFGTTVDSGVLNFGSAPMSLPVNLPPFGAFLEMDCSIPGVNQGQFSHVTTYDIP